MVTIRTNGYRVEIKKLPGRRARTGSFLLGFVWFFIGFGFNGILLLIFFRVKRAVVDIVKRHCGDQHFPKNFFQVIQALLNPTQFGPALYRPGFFGG